MLPNGDCVLRKNQVDRRPRIWRGAGGLGHLASASAARRRPPSSPGAQCPAGYNRNPTRFPDSMVDYGTQTKFERHRSHFADCSKWSRNSWSLLLVDLMWPSGKFSDTKCLQWAPKSATTSDSNQAPISTRPAWAPSGAHRTRRVQGERPGEVPRPGGSGAEMCARKRSKMMRFEGCCTPRAGTRQRPLAG